MPTSINQSLIPNADAVFDLGSVALTWFDVWMNQAEFTAVGVGTAGNREIFGNTTGMIFNIPTGKNFVFRVNNVFVGEIAGDTIQGFNNLILDNSLF